MNNKPLCLASTSKYRSALLKQLHIPFEVQKPAINEDEIKTTLLHLSPLELCQKLSYLKGFHLSKTAPHTTIISGDQLVAYQNQVLGKAHTEQGAYEQLRRLSGHTHQLITSIDVFSGDQHLSHTEISELTLKDLSDNEIRHYIQLDKPWDCAGSYKIESYGIGLFSQIKTTDYTAIQGLPLIWLSQTLKGLGYELYSG